MSTTLTTIATGTTAAATATRIDAERIEERLQRRRDQRIAAAAQAGWVVALR